MKYGYTRVSIVHQDLESQIRALRQKECNQIFQDKLVRMNKNRPQIVQL